MFKRVEKRIKKREEDKALDIDDETREALGLNETDSDESDDSEESDVFDQQDEDESDEWGGLGYEASDVDEHMEDVNADEHDTSEEEDLGDVGEKRQVSFQAFTVDQALKEPIYVHPSQSKASLCALCPGKTLIGPLTISQHRESKAHARRSQRMSELAALPGNKDHDFSDLLKEMDGGKPQVETQGESKRAEKKRKTAEIWKVKREKRKEREKAKKEKQKQDAEGKELANGKRLTGPNHAALSDTKDEKHRTKSAEKTPTTKARGDKQTKKSGGEMPQPSASNVNPQANKRKRKPEKEKEKQQGPAEKAQAPPSKKRKTGADNAPSSSEKIDITRQIKNIAKSATKRAHQALDKANKGSGSGPLKIKGGMKKKWG